ncbi:PrpF domain-containing protein [Acerihabitans sp. TG2]|uniref:PrpF domain-containing protein n=1 Tax=Acerihabitans sp. TG2 TaxID=3096008 RepID=UPI002B226F0E|nr:PrpF domain-containing protein [Acerihabitans sp. TG2]MEA9393030.1 PrpF domain-containing protein [Acerihabitans sp. TG2]
MAKPSPAPLALRYAAGQFEFPVHHMRGGTSTGLVLWEGLMPASQLLREELLRHLMGVPLTGELHGNRQITGLGRGTATSNKVFLARVEEVNGQRRIVSTLAQLAAGHGRIDWSVNCGNMSSSLLLWALDAGMITGQVEADIANTNTGVVTTARMQVSPHGHYAVAEIPGVDGAYPRVDLFLHDPMGSKTGRMLPTGRASDEVAGCTVSCVDVAVPMVIANAVDFGKTAHESTAELEGDAEFIRQFRHVWIEAALRMGLRNKDGVIMGREDIALSETLPKACIIGRPKNGGHLAVRYFTPQTVHASMAVSGGCCLAAAALIPGTVANHIAQGVPTVLPQFSDLGIGIENPAGILETVMDARMTNDLLEIRRAAYRRNTQILLRGYTPIYRASDALLEALDTIYVSQKK